MGGSTALALFALQLLTGLEGPALGTPEPPSDPRAGAPLPAPSERADRPERSWLVLRRADRERPVALVAPEPGASQ
ncbi:MAG: hypothetical protein KatS3mg117_1888 [Geminicoccaceae bacterium]|jgi:hypothetical protein|nr:MAG: hypothetical protein KatS3mg117_1888 [Geminicoccaceae bacterium]